MAVTIKDVARVAQVSPSTVSRVIADNPRISEETKRRVREAMDELGYHPNFQARSLVVKSTKTIGIIMPNSATQVLENPFFPEVLRGISLIARENRFGIYLSTGATQEEIFEEVIQMVQGRRVDGIILLYSKTDDKIMKYLLDEDFPFTVIGRPFHNAERITYVDNDNIYATKQVTKYLIDKGHKKIAFIGVNTEDVFTIDRMEGYKQAMEEAGIPIKEDYVIHEKWLKENEKEAIIEYFFSKELPTAIVLTDDFLAIKLMSIAEDLSIRVPEDISLVSFNNIMLCQYMRPPLSSVDINIFQLGLEAANCLLDKINHPETLPKRITIPAKMIERKTCAKIIKEQNE
ncbi:LacI family transcriptional regulator [Heyndrickxia sporothermodurans]|uniref:LacI family DNA-binding transcriptional regulator n=1 Tax=Heyndrickxia TaxID=2837504 RepID=UPI000D3820E4|nr:LacI family DNA-binding transcriptional regulator [Heyndrickxia sporothermodurans]PTY80754.1 LacI family transcriptional regulator [Heyndrickxia sporothermodurans]